jgi:tripartite ATP-independent transporter DctM subunit
MDFALLMIAFVVMLVLGFPIIFALGIASLSYLIINNITLAVTSQVMVNYLTEFVLLAVPLFIFGAQLMNAGGMTERMIKLLRTTFGGIRGSLAQINVVSSMIFAGISGAAVADASSIGTIMIKSMKDEGYDVDYAAAITAASATVGPIIPPSIPMVVAGAMAGLSVSRLFVGGIIPGILLGVSMMIIAAFIAKKKNHPIYPRASVKEIAISFKEAGIDLLIPGLVVGGIVLGWFTPTEAAGITVLSALILGFIIHRDLTWQKLVDCAYDTILVTAEVLLIGAVAVMFSWVLTYERIPQNLIQYVLDLNLSPAMLLFIINIIILILGALIAGMATLLIAVPVILPLAPILGLSPYHLVMVLVFGCMLGTITPPVGVTVYIVSSISKRPIGAIVKAMIPFLIVSIGVLFLITYVPLFTEWLPSLFFK